MMLGAALVVAGGIEPQKTRVEKGDSPLFERIKRHDSMQPKPTAKQDVGDGYRPHRNGYVVLGGL
jgi:hypothetical protein